MDHDAPLLFRPDELRERLALHQPPARPSATSLFALVQAACARAEERLSPFKGSSILDSRLTILAAPDPGPCHWSQRQSTCMEMTRKSAGWTLTDLRKALSPGAVSERLSCSAFQLLEAERQLVGGPCADLFLRHAEAGLFPIDEPLPGSHADPAHPKPLNALAYCSFLGRARWVERLLLLGADPLLHGAYGKTALHLCAAGSHQRGSAECARLLLAAGADPRALNSSGKTPAASLRSGTRDSDTGSLLASVAAAALEALRIAAAVNASATQAPLNAQTRAKRPRL